MTPLCNPQAIFHNVHCIKVIPLFMNSKHSKITCKQLSVLLFTTHSPSGLGFHVKFVKMHVVQHLRDNPISNHVKALLCNRSYGN